MENSENQKKQSRLLPVALVVLFAALLLTIIFIIKQFMGLNDSVEYERSVFISQIAEQMKNNVIISRKNHLENIQSFAVILDEVQPSNFEQVRSLFPDYAGSEAVNRLFFLSADCELYGIDGIKQWTSLPHDDYFLNVLSDANTADFIRIGQNQEFMVYSALLPEPIEIEGHEISAILYGWDSSEYRATLSSRLFEEKSSSLLVGKNGNIAIYPEDEDSETYGYNIFSYLSNQGMKEENLEIIRELLSGTKDKTVLCEVDGSRWLFSSACYSEQYRVFIMLPIQTTSAGTYQNLYGLIAGVATSFLILFLIVGIIILSVVLRQRVQRERELQTELLMKTAQAKNDFLAKMSHDIRTPLNGIIGMNYIASTRVPSEFTEIADYLKKVDISARYLLGILNDILDMSKIESGELRLSAAPFSLEALKEGIEPLVLSQMEGKNIRFIINASEFADCDYIGDELRLKQILMNLLSNAVKFTEKGSVTLAILTHPVDEKTDQVTFSVQDTGKGMSEEFLNHIFVPFTQEDDGTAAGIGGSGLGLSIVKSFVELMGGTISVSSKPEKGSEFTVTLLLKKAEFRKAKALEIPEMKTVCSFPGRHVLLCEDNDLNAEIAEVILGDFHLKVDRAENGETGVALFEQSAQGYYDMIFMDVRMPKVDGYEATRMIRALERPDAKQVTICALSANAFSDDIRQSMDAGMNEHLAKPLDITMLAEVLQKYLG